MERKLDGFVAEKKTTTEQEDINGLYDAFSVCRHLVNYSSGANTSIDLERINLLLYFVQAKFLFKSKCAYACFDEEIMAVSCGNKDLLTIDIKESEKYDHIDDEDRLLIESVVDRYIDKSNEELTNVIINSSPYAKSICSQNRLSVIKKDKIFEWTNEIERLGEIPAKYGVAEIGAFVVNQSELMGVFVDVLRLHQILFLIQGCYLVYHDGKKACFEEDFVTSAYGPMVPKTQKDYRLWGYTFISKITKLPLIKITIKGEGRKYSKFRYEKPTFNDAVIDVADKEIMIEIIEEAALYSTDRLVDSFMSQECCKEIYSSSNKAKTISKASIYEVFKPKR